MNAESFLAGFSLGRPPKRILGALRQANFDEGLPLPVQLLEGHFQTVSATDLVTRTKSRKLAAKTHNRE